MCLCVCRPLKFFFFRLYLFNKAFSGKVVKMKNLVLFEGNLGISLVLRKDASFRRKLEKTLFSALGGPLTRNIPFPCTSPPPLPNLTGQHIQGNVVTAALDVVLSFVAYFRISIASNSSTTRFHKKCSK